MGLDGKKGSGWGGRDCHPTVRTAKSMVIVVSGQVMFNTVWSTKTVGVLGYVGIVLSSA